MTKRLAGCSGGKSKEEMKWVTQICRISLVFALLSSCEREARTPKAPEDSAANRINRKPEDPVERFRTALGEGHLEQAQSALERVPDEEYRRFLRDQLNGALERQIRQRANENPEETLDAISNGKEQLEIFWLEVAMSEFLTKDREAALAWHTTHAGNLDIEGNDRILLAIARNSLASGDWQTARQIKDKVVSPDLKHVIGDGIGAAMEKDIRGQVRKSADEAMRMLMSGQSGFETFWIEVAINEFLSTNPKGAEKWYWNHGTSLTQDQHDRVALAYARAANQSGDKIVASQWANQIKEQELRDAVLGEIEN